MRLPRLKIIDSFRFGKTSEQVNTELKLNCFSLGLVFFLHLCECQFVTLKKNGIPFSYATRQCALRTTVYKTPRMLTGSDDFCYLCCHVAGLIWRC